MFPSLRQVLAVGFIVAVPLGPAKAAGDLTAQEPVEIKVQLGNEKDTLRFFPDTIKLETGKLWGKGDATLLKKGKKGTLPFS